MKHLFLKIILETEGYNMAKNSFLSEITFYIFIFDRFSQAEY